MTRRRSVVSGERWASSRVLRLLCMGFACAGTHAFAAPPPVECGAVITQNIKLLTDVGPCTGDGLIVAVDGVSINLNGHKVFGTQRLHVGIRLENVSNVSVVGGTVEGFDTGVLVVGGLTDTVTGVTFRNNRFGIQLQNAPSSGHQISKNVITNNRLIGILLNPDVSGATVNKNSASGNIGYGIVLAGGASLNVVSDNDAFGNGVSSKLDILLRGGDANVSRTNLIPPLLAMVAPSPTTYVNGVDYQVLGAGDFVQDPGFDVTGRLVPVGITLDPAATAENNPIPADSSASGCQLSDYLTAGFQPGNVALVQRGTCELDVKAKVALNAGAAGVILFNEGQAPTRTAFNFGGIGSFFVAYPVVLGASYSLGYQLYNLSRSGVVTVRIVAKTSGQFLSSAPSNNNRVIKNSADHAFDENIGQPTSESSFVCGTNQWIKNVLGDGAAACSPGGGAGGGATIHSY